MQQPPIRQESSFRPTLAPPRGHVVTGRRPEASYATHAAHVPHADHEVPVVTVLSPAERARVDAAGEGLYRAVHRETVEDALRELRERRASAVLVSVARCGGRDAARVARVVREFPRVPAVALLTQLEAATPQAVLSLGRCGVERLVDVRSPQGWRELREVLARDRGDAFSRLAMETLASDIAGAPPECHGFFALLFGPTAAPAPTVRALARRLGVVPSTLMSRLRSPEDAGSGSAISLMESAICPTRSPPLPRPAGLNRHHDRHHDRHHSASRQNTLCRPAAPPATGSSVVSGVA